MVINFLVRIVTALASAILVSFFPEKEAATDAGKQEREGGKRQVFANGISKP